MDFEGTEELKPSSAACFGHVVGKSQTGVRSPALLPSPPAGNALIVGGTVGIQAKGNARDTHLLPSVSLVPGRADVRPACACPPFKGIPGIAGSPVKDQGGGVPGHTQGSQEQPAWAAQARV